jgi:peptide deformylase
MIITNDEGALRVKCANVLSEEIGSLIEQLEKELKYSADVGRPGIGLAAPQIGIAKNIAIVRTGKYKIDLVNCIINKGFDQAVFEQEGCLSFPGRIEKTNRYQEIHVINNVVEPYSFIATGLLAVVCQHELNHLEGILLPDVAIKQKIINVKKAQPNDKCPCGQIDMNGKTKKYKKCCGR